jgi:hypothetical protein
MTDLLRAIKLETFVHVEIDFLWFGYKFNTYNFILEFYIQIFPKALKDIKHCAHTQSQFEYLLHARISPRTLY